MPQFSGNSFNRVAGQPIVDRVQFGSDFLHGPVASSTDDAAVFDLVGTSAGLVLADDEVNGVGTLTSNSTNVALLVLNGEPISLRANNEIQVDARVNLTDADGMSFFAGIAKTTADPFSAMTDYIGFYTTDGSIKIGTGKNATSAGAGSGAYTEIDTGLDFANDTWAKLTFNVHGTTAVDFYVDGVHVGRITTNLPDDENLTLVGGQIGSGETVDFDYLFGEADRDWSV